MSAPETDPASDPAGGGHRSLHSFPTRRSSDLGLDRPADPSQWGAGPGAGCAHDLRWPADPRGDRKSTRLNSSHVAISYAVFCLKKTNLRAVRSYIHPVHAILIRYAADVYPRML